MIICFSNNFNPFNKNNFIFSQNFIQSFMPTIDSVKYCKCPKCHAFSNFSVHGYYNRNIVFISPSDNSINNYLVSVTRVICNSCASTHALLPHFIVPYKAFSLPSLLYIIAQASSSSAYTIAINFNLSFQFIYSILATFFSFFPQVSLLHNETHFCNITNFNFQYFSLNCLNICDHNFLYLFFLHNKWIFLMTKFRSVPAPPIFFIIAFPQPHNF